MSKFIEKIKRLSEGGHQPIGFGIKKEAAPGPKIQLVASFTQENTSGADMNGADAVLLNVTGTGAAESVKKISESFPDIPCGVSLQGVGKTEMKQIIKAGCDFLVFPAADTPVTATDGEKEGKIIQVETSIDEGLLRTVNTLPVDAVLVSGEGKKEATLTWQQLMLYQRFADLLTKPLLITVSEKITTGELLSLWEAGVSGVVVEAGGQERIKKLRQEIDKADFPPKRRREKSEAVLPRAGRESATSAVEEDDEDY